jgi:hypothetical protein
MFAWPAKPGRYPTTRRLKSVVGTPTTVLIALKGDLMRQCVVEGRREENLLEVRLSAGSAGDRRVAVSWTWRRGVPVAQEVLPSTVGIGHRGLQRQQLHAVVDLDPAEEGELIGLLPDHTRRTDARIGDEDGIRGCTGLTRERNRSAVVDRRSLEEDVVHRAETGSSDDLVPVVLPGDDVRGRAKCGRADERGTRQQDHRRKVPHARPRSPRQRDYCGGC